MQCCCDWNPCCCSPIVLKELFGITDCVCVTSYAAGSCCAHVRLCSCSVLLPALPAAAAAVPPDCKPTPSDVPAGVITVDCTCPAAAVQSRHECKGCVGVSNHQDSNRAVQGYDVRTYSMDAGKGKRQAIFVQYHQGQGPVGRL
jgi:hypothetical protein